MYVWTNTPITAPSTRAAVVRIAGLNTCHQTWDLYRVLANKRTVFAFLPSLMTWCLLADTKLSYLVSSNTSTFHQSSRDMPRLLGSRQNKGGESISTLSLLRSRCFGQHRAYWRSKFSRQPNTNQRFCAYKVSRSIWTSLCMVNIGMCYPQRSQNCAKAVKSDVA